MPYEVDRSGPQTCPSAQSLERLQHHFLEKTAPAHETTTRKLGMDTRKTMMCSYATGYLAECWLVFSQVLGKHFRSSQTSVHPVGSLLLPAFHTRF